MEIFKLSIVGMVSLLAPAYTFASPVYALLPTENKVAVENREPINEGIDVYSSGISFNKSFSLTVLGSEESKIKLHILDKSGSSLYSTVLNPKRSNEIEVDLSHLPRGNYKALITQGEYS